MIRSLALLFAVALAATVASWQSRASESAPESALPERALPGRSLPERNLPERNLPMRFDLHRPGPAATCGSTCRGWIAASGAITADTPRDFERFAKGRNLAGLAVALDSDGGSVLGAIGLGREIRRLDLDTTVGRALDVPAVGGQAAHASLSPRADCESMCAFVLLAGVHRSVPPQARVMVHQIWLGDRRDDPTAANYSAEDLVLVQRDIGSLAEYTVDMGGSVALLKLALRIPPWEPMHLLTQSEIGAMHVATDTQRLPAAAAATASAAPPVAAAAAVPIQPASDDAQVTAISERRWAMVDRAGAVVLARRHPLTIEGEEIGSFDLIVSCAGPDQYDVSYAEQRHDNDQYPLPAAVTAVTLTVGNKTSALKLVSSKRGEDPDELDTLATGTLPAALIGSFAAIGNHSMMIETESALTATGIRIGNTGALSNLPRLAAGCSKAIGDRADLTLPHTGGLAAAK
jgi:hypothetical protein